MRLCAKKISHSGAGARLFCVVTKFVLFLRMPENPQQELMPLIIEKIIPEAEDAKSFVLQSASGRRIQYEAGQFLTFSFDKAGKNPARRSYSISSSPSVNEPLQITVKRIPNGEYSRWLIDGAKEGDVLHTIGASGFFTLPTGISEAQQLFFFAAGSGITPIYSLIKTVLQDYSFTQIVLVYSNRAPGNAIFYHQLKELQERYHKRFHIEFLFSSEKSILHKRLGIYLLEKLLEKYVSGPIDTRIFYICGPFEYMRMITIVLRNNGVALANIHKEIFSIEKPVRKIEPPDKDIHHVRAILDGNDYRFDVHYPQTILQRAKALKIPLPYSCENGQCGTCAATCISGKIWMWHNDVLMEEELAAGRVLTCTGFPVGGDVVLQY